MNKREREVERLERWYGFKHSVIAQLQEVFDKSGMTYAELGSRLSWTEQQAKDRMMAQCRVKTRWMHEMAWELGFYIQPTIKHIKYLGSK